MLWIDHPSYYGPDRRISEKRWRTFERRRENLAGPAPTLERAMMQLRLHVLDASGPSGTHDFGQRVISVAMLAEQHDEPEIADALNSLALMLSRWQGVDLRTHIYDQLGVIGAPHTVH